MADKKELKTKQERVLLSILDSIADDESYHHHVSELYDYIWKQDMNVINEEMLNMGSNGECFRRNMGRLFILMLQSEYPIEYTMEIVQTYASDCILMSSPLWCPPDDIF